MAALWQHIVYNEYVPLVLGPSHTQRFGLALEKHGYWDGALCAAVAMNTTLNDKIACSNPFHGLFPIDPVIVETTIKTSSNYWEKKFDNSKI